MSASQIFVLCFLFTLTCSEIFKYVLANRISEDDKRFQVVSTVLLKKVCRLSDLVKNTGGKITYCDYIDGPTVPDRHGCDVSNVTKSGNNALQTFWCEDGVWRREFGTETNLSTGPGRQKRFIWLIFTIVRIVACILTCFSGSQQSQQPQQTQQPQLPQQPHTQMGAPPSYSYCPPTKIKTTTTYYAPRGAKASVVVWTEPPSSGEGKTSSLTCCGGFSSGQFFPGSVDGTTYYMTYTVKDKYGRTDSCAFSFTVFNHACTEPTPSFIRIKHTCTNGLLYGSECTFQCKEGYMISSGMSHTATCEKINGNAVKWTTLPECQKMKCPTPSSPENGQIICSNSMHEFGTMCFMSCNNGYRLSGAPVSYCTSDGLWSSTADNVICKDDEPPDITCSSHVFYAESGKSTARVNWTEPEVNDNLESSLKAEKRSTINQGDELWEGTYHIAYQATDSAGNSHRILSQCSVFIQVQVIKCASGPTDSLSDNRFMRYNCNNTIFSTGVQCTVFCDLNLDLNGSDTMTCMRDEIAGTGVWKWSGPIEPHCNVVQCPPLIPPAHGALTYDTVNARPIYIMLCQSGYDSPVVGSSFTGRLDCRDSGKWYPLEKFPDCIVSRWGDIVLPAELIYAGNCEKDNTKENIRKAVLKYLNDIKNEIDDSICPGKNCRAENVMIECGSRNRREVEHELTKRETSYVRVTFELATQFDLTNSTEREAYTELFPLLRAIGNRVKADVAEGKLDVAGFTIAEDGFQTSSVPNLKCPSALKKDGYKCKPCPKGTYFKSTTGNCELCNIGEYNEEDGRAECDLCPPTHSTLNNGSKHQEDCTPLCDIGFVSETTMAPCFPCPLGSYQPKSGASVCIKCPFGHTTSSTNSTSVTQCKVFDLKVNNLYGNHLIGHFNSDVVLSIMSVSIWIKRDGDETGELTLKVGDASGDDMAIRLAQTVTVESGTLSSTTSLSLSSKRWFHLLVELDFSSNLLTVFVNGVEDAKIIGLASTSIESGKIFMSSGNDTGLLGVTISGLTIYPRKLLVEEIAEFGSWCTINSTDTLFSMTDTVQHIIDGMIISTETSCDPFDECATRPCGNHTCVNGIGTFTCVCSGGWTGTRCDVPPDYCLNHDCKHGFCVPGHGKYTCNCTDFYTGSDCSIPPLHGGWSSWSDWTACDVTCGGGTHSRQRLCVNPPPGPDGLSCDGDDNEILECNTKECPDCPRLNRSFGTIPKCQNDPTTAELICMVSCEPGKTFPNGQEPYSKYTCGRTTGYTWQPFGKIPECVDASSPFKAEAQINAVFTEKTSQETKEDLEKKVVSNLKTMSCIAGMKCEVTASISDSQERRKRSTGTSIKLSYTIQLPALTSLDMAGYEQNATVSSDLQTLKDAFSTVEEQYQYFLDNAETIFNVTVDGVRYSVDPNTIDAFIGAYCNPGFSGSNGFCVECPRGMHEVDAMCQICDVGTFQSSTGQTKCEPCPTGYTTAAYMATSIEECNVRITTQVDDVTESKQEKPDSNTAAIASSISTVVVVAGVITIGVLYYKRSRKQSRTARSKSLASLNMVRPEVVGSMAQMQPRGAELANVRFIRENSLDYYSPTPPHERPHTKLSMTDI